jgi:hypothetical protein
VAFGGQKLSDIEPVRHVRDARGSNLSSDGELTLVPSVVALHQCDNPPNDGQRQQQHERRHGAPSESERPTVLADVLADQLVLRQAVERRGQLAHAVPKAWIPHGYVLLGAGPTQVEPQRFAGEPFTKPGRDWRCLVEVPPSVIPAELAVRKGDQNGFVAPVLAPPANLLINPTRVRRLLRSHKHEIPRLGQRPLDRRPQLRGSGQTALVAEHPQCPPSIPGLRKRLQARLQRRGQPPIRRVAIRNEGIVGRCVRAWGRNLGSSCRGGSHDERPASPREGTLPLRTGQRKCERSHLARASTRSGRAGGATATRPAAG